MPKLQHAVAKISIQISHAGEVGYPGNVEENHISIKEFEFTIMN